LGVLEFQRSFEAGDGEGFVADLAPGFKFFHAGHAAPTTDHDVLRRIIPFARNAMGPEFRFTDHMVGEEYHALPWVSRIGEYEADGVDLIKEDDDGRLLEVRITMRPLEALLLWAEAMTAQLPRREHES
jgi:hypothetical protein